MSGAAKASKFIHYDPEDQKRKRSKRGLIPSSHLLNDLGLRPFRSRAPEESSSPTPKLGRSRKHPQGPPKEIVPRPKETNSRQPTPFLLESSDTVDDLIHVGRPLGTPFTNPVVAGRQAGIPSPTDPAVICMSDDEPDIKVMTESSQAMSIPAHVAAGVRVLCRKKGDSQSGWRQFELKDYLSSGKLWNKVAQRLEIPRAKVDLLEVNYKNPGGFAVAMNAGDPEEWRMFVEGLKMFCAGGAGHVGLVVHVA